MGEYSVGIATRERIYSVCEELFYKKGIQATSYSDICEAADVNRGLIPYHFKSKTNIAVLIYRGFLESMEKAVQDKWNPSEVGGPVYHCLVELFMFRLFAENAKICRFYSEIEFDEEFHETTFAVQGEVMRSMAQGGGSTISDDALRTVVAMAEGTEMELVWAILTGYIREPIEDLVRRDFECCYTLLGIDLAKSRAWCDEALKIAEGFKMTCDKHFKCRIVKL